MRCALTDDEILREFGCDADSEWDFARMVDRECSRSTRAITLDDDDARSYDHIMTIDLHSRSDIVRLAGVDNDVFTFWLRHGLVRPLESAVGRGKVLRFDRSQVLVAKLLANARSTGLNLDALKAIAGAVQSAIEVYAKADAPYSMLSSIIEEVEGPGGLNDRIETTRRIAAQHPNPGLAKLVARYEQDDFEASLIKAASAFTKDDIDSLWFCLQLLEAAGYLIVYFDTDDGQWKVNRSAGLDGARLPAPACILLDLTPLASLAEIDA